jgi:hypothetical protein
MWNGLSRGSRDFVSKGVWARQIKGRAVKGRPQAEREPERNVVERRLAATLEGPVSGEATMDEEARQGFLGATGDGVNGEAR